MVQRRAATVLDVDFGPLLADMGRLNDSIGRINMVLPIKSPVRAMLKTLTDQTREVAATVTGDRDYFSGKAPSVNTAWKPNSGA